MWVVKWLDSDGSPTFQKKQTREEAGNLQSFIFDKTGKCPDVIEEEKT